jgi:hypothetical protein
MPDPRRRQYESRHLRRKFSRKLKRQTRVDLFWGLMAVVVVTILIVSFEITGAALVGWLINGGGR